MGEKMRMQGRKTISIITQWFSAWNGTTLWSQLKSKKTVEHYIFEYMYTHTHIFENSLYFHDKKGIFHVDNSGVYKDAY